MDIPKPIRGFYSTFLDGLNAVLQRKLFAVYLYGAWAFQKARRKVMLIFT